MGCWRGYLSGALWRLAHGSADATATLSLSCFSKIQIGFTFLVPAHTDSPGERAVKRVCVCANVFQFSFISTFSCICVADSALQGVISRPQLLDKYGRVDPGVVPRSYPMSSRPDRAVRDLISKRRRTFGHGTRHSGHG